MREGVKRSEKMKKSDRYIKIVKWSEQDGCYVGTCPSLMLGGVHGDDETNRGIYRNMSRLRAPRNAAIRPHR